ncbi:uncharacterized protein B0T15DRAFT_575445 [Chaetomium strumarium]|uniref:Uncharacterized protein n=1 Tax=Chaetomium strumarium TaxID=1170767 RepID=A0AAJ0LZX9_9PEZI|nr:hypothetical protein B0T15DRAFT_575445 [Chaetomium strumarium]
MNFTLTVPEGSTNHGNPKLLCTPPEWYDFIIFFFTNYVAHAATVVPEPGQSPVMAALQILLALTLPGSAVFRAVNAIARHAATETKDPLRRAARANALCMVLKKRPATKFLVAIRSRDNRSEVESGDTAGNSIRVESWQPKEKTFRSHPIPPDATVHGEYWLHEDYYFAVVLPTASLTLSFDHDGRNPEDIDLGNLHHSKAVLASSHNILKLSISYVQAMWATATVYRARRDQIHQYGYAAFGLTVAPYAVMSILNTLANMLTPEYPAMFVIRTPAMADAERENKGFFKGAIRVDLENANNTTEGTPTRGAEMLPELRPLVKIPTSVILASLLLSLVPLAIVEGLSGFQEGNSSQLERGFTMSWLIVGTIYGVLAGINAGLSGPGDEVVTSMMAVIQTSRTRRYFRLKVGDGWHKYKCPR